jgi:putative transposase
MIDRFFRSLKEECTWQHNFPGYQQARQTIRQWIQWYNAERPHQALRYLSPLQYRARYVEQVA